MKAAMDGDWKETRKKRINNPDHDPASFEGYLNWVDSGQITLSDEEELCAHCVEDTSEGANCVEKQSLELAKMFILGDSLHDVRFRNAIVDNFKFRALKSTCVRSRKAACCVWERASNDCQLRELFLQHWTSTLGEDSTGPYLKNNETPRDFLVDLLLFVRKRHVVILDEDADRDK